MRSLQVTGLNHTTAPLELRERLALPHSRLPEATAAFQSRFPGSKFVFLFTCNRAEVYCVAGSAPTGPDATTDVAAFLADFFQVPRQDFEQSLYRKSGHDAVEHLFRVAASLDSMVLGETQILGQVRAAYDAAHRLGSTGPLLNGLFQRAIAAAKRVMSETRLGDGRVSAASVAVDYARSIFDHFDDKTLLCIGSGEMVALVLRHFAALRPGHVIVAGRDPARANSLARHSAAGQFHAAPLSDLPDCLALADIVVTCTASSAPLVTWQMFKPLQRRRRYRPAFMIDLAVPRDIEPTVGRLANVHLYNIDDLQNVVGQSQQLRGQAAQAASTILARHVQDLIAWNRQRELGPAIRRLYQRQYELARAELRRTLGGANDPDLSHRIDQLARRLVNKLLHEPMRALREPSHGHEAAGRYLHAIDKLFRLGLDDGIVTEHPRIEVQTFPAQALSDSSPQPAAD
jgi:glutamyl-tRNA reductase